LTELPYSHYANAHCQTIYGDPIHARSLPSWKFNEILVSRISPGDCSSGYPAKCNTMVVACIQNPDGASLRVFLCPDILS